MRVNEIKKQTFGMSYNINAKNLKKAYPSEIKKFKNILNNYGSTLNKVTPDTNATLTPTVKDGNLEKIEIMSLPIPKNFKEKCMFLLKRAIDELKTNKIHDKSSVDFKDIDKELLDSAEYTSAEALKRFNNMDRVKTLLK